jgi:exodeoxyribonuclease VII small subunit
VPAPRRALECRDARGVSGVNSTPGKKPEPAKHELPKKPAFEQSLARLEEIVRKLESANLPLEDAMKLFEEGMQLSRDCQKQLEQAEARVEILLKKAGGEMTAQPFEPESEEET